MSALVATMPPAEMWALVQHIVAVYGEPYRRLGPPGPGTGRVWLVSRRIPGAEWPRDPRLRELKRDFRKVGRTRISGAVRVTLYSRRIRSGS